MKARFLVPLALASLSVATSSAAQDEPTQTADDAAPADAPPPPPAVPASPSKKTAGVIRVDGGFAYRNLHSLPITGASIGAALGMERKRWGIGGSLQGMFGSTEHGLSMRTMTVLAEAELILDRFRLGGGLGVMAIGIDRAFRSETLTSLGAAVQGSLRFDVLRLDDVVFFARATIQYATLTAGPNADFWGPTFGAGIDFDLAPRPEH